MSEEKNNRIISVINGDESSTSIGTSDSDDGDSDEADCNNKADVFCVKKSLIEGAGMGLFTRKAFKKGQIVLIWTFDANYITEDEYNKKQSAGDIMMVKTGARYIGGVFLYTDTKDRYENYINHSKDANILYHCGICFALRDIEVGEELYVDYRYVLSEYDVESFRDPSGTIVRGGNSGDVLLETTEKLLELLRGAKRQIECLPSMNNVI